MIINDNLLNVNEYLPESNIKDTTIIFTHGLAEYSKSYIEIAEFFVNNGFNVITYDLQGHGKSHGKRGYIKSYKDYVKDLHELVLYAKKQTSNVYLVGHSLGGIITNLYVSTHNNVDGVIISSSPNDYLERLDKLRKIPKFLINNKKLKTFFNDPNLSSAKYEVDAFDLDYVYVRISTEVLIKGMKELHKIFSNNTTPVLFLYSKNDKIVNYSHGEFGMEQIGSSDKTLILYEKSNHNIFTDIEKDIIFNDMLEWILKRL